MGLVLVSGCFIGNKYDKYLDSLYAMAASFPRLLSQDDERPPVLWEDQHRGKMYKKKSTSSVV